MVINSKNHHWCVLGKLSERTFFDIYSGEKRIVFRLEKSHKIEIF